MKTLEDLGAAFLARTGDAQEIIGADDATPVVSEGAQTVGALTATVWSLLSAASTAYCGVHGYKRNNSSVGWALGWGFLGGMFPVITPAIAYAQGFGKPKAG